MLACLAVGGAMFLFGFALATVVMQRKLEAEARRLRSRLVAWRGLAFRFSGHVWGEKPVMTAPTPSELMDNKDYDAEVGL